MLVVRDEGLVAVPLAGGATRVVVGGRIGSLPVWSPDGERLAVLVGNRVAVQRADGSDPHAYAAPAFTRPIAFDSTGRRLLLSGGTVIALTAGAVSHPYPQEDVEAVSADWSQLAI